MKGDHVGIKGGGIRGMEEGMGGNWVVVRMGMRVGMGAA